MNGGLMVMNGDFPSGKTYTHNYWKVGILGVFFWLMFGEIPLLMFCEVGLSVKDTTKKDTLW